MYENEKILFKQHCAISPANILNSVQKSTIYKISRPLARVCVDKIRDRPHDPASVGFGTTHAVWCHLVVKFQPGTRPCFQPSPLVFLIKGAVYRKPTGVREQARTICTDEYMYCRLVFFLILKRHLDMQSIKPDSSSSQQLNWLCWDELA